MTVRTIQICSAQSFLSFPQLLLHFIVYPTYLVQTNLQRVYIMSSCCSQIFFYSFHNLVFFTRRTHLCAWGEGTFHSKPTNHSEGGFTMVDFDEFCPKFKKSIERSHRRTVCWYKNQIQTLLHLFSLVIDLVYSCTQGIYNSIANSSLFPTSMYLQWHFQS